MPQRHKSRHAGARRQAGDVHARRIQAMTPHFRADQRGDQVGLAAAVQRVGLEPAPAALHLPGHGLLRVQHHEAGRVGPLVHARTLRERQRGLATAVQHDHQRHALARHAGRNVAGEGETPAQAVGELARGLPAAQAQRGRGAVARGIGAAPGRRPARRGGALAGGAGHGQVQGRALDPAELFAALKTEWKNCAPLSGLGQLNLACPKTTSRYHLAAAARPPTASSAGRRMPDLLRVLSNGPPGPTSRRRW